jgi:aminoglycoside 6'-N-acetyltransferase I
MNIVDLTAQAESLREQAAALLVEHFNEHYGWPTLDLARKEVTDVLHNGFARAMLDSETVLGWVGGLPEYNGHVWELHPIVVRPEHWRRGIGRALVAAFESEARKRGAYTVTLGTDDHTGMTSLAGVNLYDDLLRRLTEVRDLGQGHPFGFYRKLG